MSIIGMAVYSTPENKKDECLRKTLRSLFATVDFSKHRLYLSINAATEETESIIKWYTDNKVISGVIRNEENIGTARAINKVWKLRNKGEHCLKMDDDIVIHDRHWLDRLEDALRSDALIGQIGLKRKDLCEFPGHKEADYRSELIMLPHVPGEPWQVVEKVKHVIGSCVLHSAQLVDKVGGLYQPGIYGYDDVIYSHRCYLSGFYSCFLPHINIDHIDDGKTPYQGWKERYAGEFTQAVIDEVRGMYNYTKTIYHPFE